MRLDLRRTLQACPAEGVEGSAMVRASLRLVLSKAKGYDGRPWHSCPIASWPHAAPQGGTQAAGSCRNHPAGSARALRPGPCPRCTTETPCRSRRPQPRQTAVAVSHAPPRCAHGCRRLVPPAGHRTAYRSSRAALRCGCLSHREAAKRPPSRRDEPLNEVKGCALRSSRGPEMRLR